MDIRWSDTDLWKPWYLERSLSRRCLLTINPTWTKVGCNLDCCGERPAPNSPEPWHGAGIVVNNEWQGFRKKRPWR
jgi:hypothetical protein